MYKMDDGSLEIFFFFSYLDVSYVFMNELVVIVYDMVWLYYYIGELDDGFLLVLMLNWNLSFEKVENIFWWLFVWVVGLLFVCVRGD